MKQYTYCIKNVKNGSVTCSSPKVVWITGTGQAIPCPDQGDGCITIQVPDDISACVSGEIICENCGECPSKPFTICPCTTNQDCTDCQTCTNGICTDLCSGECIGGQCVDCLTADDCTANEICVNGKCQCSPSTPYKNPHGDCVECLADNNCVNCEVCIGGTCVAKECPEGACNPSTGVCVGCVNSGDCASRTDGKTCCVGTECACCSGYIWNPQTNLCEPAPDCTTDNDCPVCEICVAGSCQPRTCPEGTICVGDTCVEECDCNIPTCSRTAACIRYNASTCICQECSGYCTGDVPCRDGCMCVNNNCVPNACNSPCASGADCGTGCGCLNNQCLPCEYLSCSEEICQLADGCKCYGSQCKGDPCKGPCENGADCGVGCGCLNGNCVSCDSIDCTECNGVLGCKCTSGICLKDAPCTGNCVSSYDCGEGCTCYNGTCVNCSNFACEDCDIDDCECLNSTCQGVEEKACNDVFTLTKIEGTCDLKATLIKERDCTCEELELQLRIVNKVPQTMTLRGVSVPANKYTYQIRILRNGIDIGNTILNDEFLSGKLRLRATYTYTDTTAAGTFEDTVYVDYNFTGLSSDLNQMITFPNIQAPNGTTNTRIYPRSVVVTLDIVNPLAHTNNCTYRGENDALDLLEREYSSTPSINDTNLIVLESSDVRAPLFQWHRAAGTSFVNDDAEFRWVYATGSSNTWEDTITGCADGLCSGLYYKVTDDCSCVGTTNSLRAIFCPSPYTFDYTVTNCGKTLTITDIFDPCDVNGDLGACTECNLNLIPSVNVIFILKITDDLGNITTENLSFNTPAEVIGQSFTMTGNIINVSLEHNQDATCKIDEAVDPAGIDANISFSCSTNTMTVVVPGTPGCTVQLKDGNTLAILATTNTDGTGTATFAGLSAGLYAITTSCSGCSATQEYTVNCCAEGTVNTIYNSGTLALQVVPGNASRLYNYTLVRPDLSELVLANNQSFNYNHPINLTNGTYKVLVDDNAGCSYESENFEVNTCSTTIINATIAYSYTAGPPIVETINITGISGSTSPYVVSLYQSGNLLFTNNGVITNTSFNAAALTDGVTYVISITDAQNPACTKNFNFLLNKQAQCDPQVDLTITSSGNCSPIQYNFWVNEAVAPYTLYIKQGGAIITNGQTGDTIVVGPTASPYIFSAGQDGSGRDLYNFQGLPDAEYTIEVVDSRGCKDTESITINCVCSNPLNVDIEGVVCEEGAHVIRFNNISGGESGNYSVYVYAGDTCDAGTLITHTTATAGAPFDVAIPLHLQVAYPGDYYVKVMEGICTTSCIAVPTIDCEEPGGGGGTGSPDCPLDDTDFNIVGDCNLTFTNNSGITVWARLETLIGSDCQTTDPTKVLYSTSQQSVAPAGNVALNVPYPGVQHRVVVTYTKQVSGDPVPCTLYMCATCTTAPSCTLTVDPVVCKKVVSGVYKISILNSNANAVKVEYSVNGGILKNGGVLAAGGNLVVNQTGDFNTAYVKFTCMNDLTETRDITVNPVNLCS